MKWIIWSLQSILEQKVNFRNTKQKKNKKKLKPINYWQTCTERSMDKDTVISPSKQCKMKIEHLATSLCTLLTFIIILAS